jgi:hypothetical protein
VNSIDLEKLNHSNRCKWTLKTDLCDYNSV